MVDWWKKTRDSQWVLINRLKITQLPHNLAAQIVCPSPNVLMKKCFIGYPYSVVFIFNIALQHNCLFMIIWVVKFSREGYKIRMIQKQKQNKTLRLYKDFEPVLHRTKYVWKSVHFKNTWLHDPNFFQNCGTFQYEISWLCFDLYWNVLQFWKKWESCIFLKWIDFTSSTFFKTSKYVIHVL